MGGVGGWVGWGWGGGGKRDGFCWFTLPQKTHPKFLPLHTDTKCLLLTERQFTLSTLVFGFGNSSTTYTFFISLYGHTFLGKSASFVH